MKVMLVFIFLLCCSAASFGQTVAQIQEKYGQPIKVYSVSEHVWMSPEFTDDGQLCMARLYPKKVDANNNYIDSTISLWEVKSVFDELSPAAVRGEKKGDFGTTYIGGMAFSGFDYENVRINFLACGFSPTCPVIDKRHIEKVEEFPNISSAQIVTITWLNRKCANP